MKIFLSIAIICTYILVIQAQTDNNKVVLGTIDSISSKILNEKRKIWVYVPNADGSVPYAKQRYPVVYLLDGDAHFYSVVGMIQQLSTVNGNMICPEMIVVAIPNTDRTRDLTPTHVDVDPPFMDSTSSKNSGGGEKFISFIEKELMPHIDSMYPTQPYKMFIGHSFGGLTVMNTIIHHTNLFNAYVAIDPSMWWDKQKLLKETKAALKEKKFTDVSLFLGIANTMEDGMDTLKVQTDTSGDTRHIRSILELNKYLKSNKQNSLKYGGKYYDMDNHGSVPLITEYDALHFIFDFYPLKLTGKDFLDTTSTLANKLDKHFTQVSKQFGYKVSPSESMINGLGYNSLISEQFAKAEKLFKMNTLNYPDSYNVYDSYGDYFNAIKDTLNAIANYQKALSIKENQESRKKLDMLTHEIGTDKTSRDLKQYTGEFVLDGETIKFFIENGSLRASVPGQSIYELEPTAQPNVFNIKGLEGYSARFEMEGNKPTAVYSIQPDGTFKATAKK